MAIHQRQAIRQAVRDMLIAAGTAADDRVYSARKDPWKEGELPGIAVDSGIEPSERSNLEGTPRRSGKITVTVVLSIEERDGDAIDAAAQQVEDALGKDPTFGGLAADSFLSETNPDLADGAGRPIGAVTLTYDVTYFTPAPA